MSVESPLTNWETGKIKRAWFGSCKPLIYASGKLVLIGQEPYDVVDVNTGEGSSSS